MRFRCGGHTDAPPGWSRHSGQVVVTLQVPEVHIFSTVSYRLSTDRQDALNLSRGLERVETTFLGLRYS